MGHGGQPETTSSTARDSPDVPTAKQASGSSYERNLWGLPSKADPPSEGFVRGYWDDVDAGTGDFRSLGFGIGSSNLIGT